MGTNYCRSRRRCDNFPSDRWHSSVPLKGYASTPPMGTRLDSVDAHHRSNFSFHLPRAVQLDPRTIVFYPGHAALWCLPGAKTKYQKTSDHDDKFVLWCTGDSRDFYPFTKSIDRYNVLGVVYYMTPTMPATGSWAKRCLCCRGNNKQIELIPQNGQAQPA